MKTLTHICVGLCILSSIVFFSSCSKDDDAAPNRILIDGRALALDKGYIEADNSSSTDDNGVEGKYYEIILFGPGLDFPSGGGDPEGTGDAVVFDIFSTTTSELANGTYEVTDEDVVGSFYAFIFENYNDATGPEDEFYANSGTITITKSGTTYTISFSFKVIFENSSGALDVADITGQFSGVLTELS